MKKKGLISIIALSATCLCAAAPACAKSDSGLFYTEVYSGGDIVGYSVRGENIKGDLEIPAEHLGKPVTSIDNLAFSNCVSMTSVTIPDSVERIGNSAFKKCDSLKSVNFADDAESALISVGYQAFADCVSLTDITIPARATNIDPGAFTGCDNITSATLPANALDGITKSNLRYCEINGGTEISSRAFLGCDLLEKVTFSDSAEALATIGDYAFASCQSLKSLEIPQSVKEIKSYAFYDCRSLYSVVISGEISVINEGAFKSCLSLVSVKIPASVKEIKFYAFDGCSSLADFAFGGTLSDWRGVNRQTDWNRSSGNFKVTCSDGEKVNPAE